VESLTPRIRPGEPQDAAEFARLVMMSDPVFLPYIFAERFETILLKLFPFRRNLFSHEHVRIIEIAGRPAGMLLGYSYRQMRSEMLRTALLFLRFAGRFLMRRGLRLLRSMPRRPRDDDSASWLAEGEFYVSNVAVKPEFRRQGLGRLLLADAVLQAAVLGCRAVALDVEAENREAIRLYEREGFIREAKNLKVLGRFEFVRLTREIEAGRE